MDGVHQRYVKPGGVLYDPESYITGAEIAAGYTFWNSCRVYRDQEHYNRAVSGAIPLEHIPAECPRIFHHRPATEGLAKGLSNAQEAHRDDQHLREARSG